MSGCVAVQPAGRGLVAVALLGDGQADDADAGVGHRREHRLRVLAGDEHVLHHVDDAAGSRRRGRARARCRRSPAARAGRAGRADEADADDAPVAAGRRHRLGDVERAVGAEEGAEAEVDDADAGARAGRARVSRGGSAGKPASVDGKDGAVDVLRGGRGEEDGGAGDVVGLAPAAGGDAVEDRLVAVGVGAQGLGVVGLDVAGRDGVDVDALRRPLVGERAWSGRRRRAWRRCRRARGCRPGRRAARRC